jgi:hypothetical protein
MDTYYANGKPIGFCFEEIATPKVVENMDFLMSDYLLNPEMKPKHQIKELYVFALESYIASKMCRSSGGIRGVAIK